MSEALSNVDSIFFLVFLFLLGLTFFYMWWKKKLLQLIKVKLLKLLLLNLVSANFHQFFIFDQMIALQILWNTFLFHLKSSSHSPDIQIFVFLTSPLFFPVSHCFRGWSNINLIVCNIINWVNKNSITYFVWDLGKGGMTLKLCLLIEY